MKRFVLAAVAGLLFSGVLVAQQVKRAAFDVTEYRIDAQLSPDENKLTATADVTFVPQEDTRSVTFELNGSLKVDSISRVAAGSMPVAAASAKGKPAKTSAPAASAGDVTFVQDQVGVSDLGPSVRIVSMRAFIVKPKSPNVS